jgi:hypothetical protein
MYKSREEFPSIYNLHRLLFALAGGCAIINGSHSISRLNENVALLLAARGN